MQIFRELAGYSLGRADVVRRAMSKKKHDVMAREREIFLHGLTAPDGTVEVDGCERRGIPATVADAVFNEMSSFASYAFNKSHAAAYATVAYQTAWLKCFYPKEYMAALLTSVLESGKVAGYIGECERMGIHVLPPSVNESALGFAVAGETIRFGLLAVKNLGRGLIQEMIREREANGPYRSFYSFCKRMSSYREFNRRALESLVKCGALDGLGANRRQMLEGAGLVLDWLDDASRRNIDGQIGFFDDPEGGAASEPSLPDIPELPYAERLAMEKEVAGLYMSGHPLQPYAAAYKALRADRTDRILAAAEEATGDYRDGAVVTLLGMVTGVRQKTTKNNATMAYVTLEDLYGALELLVFPKTLTQYGPMLQTGNVVVAAGRLSLREDEEPKLLLDRVSAVSGPEEAAALAPRQGGCAAGPAVRPAAAQGPSPRHGLYLRVASPEDPAYKRACLAIRVFDGSEPLYIRFTDSGKLVRAPQSMCVWPHAVLLEELRRIVGQENVALVK